MVNSFSDVEDSCNSFKQLFNAVADSHAPKIDVRVRGQKVPWLTSEVKKLMNERNHFHKLALKTNNVLHWSSFKRLRNVVTLKLRRNKERYFSEQLQENERDPRGTWKNLKQLYLETALKVAARPFARRKKRRQAFLIDSLSPVQKT